MHSKQQPCHSSSCNRILHRNASAFQRKVERNRDRATRAEIHRPFAVGASVFALGRIHPGFLWVTLSPLVSNSKPQQRLITPLGLCLNIRREKLITSSFRPRNSSIFFLFACASQYTISLPHILLDTKTKKKKNHQNKC